MIAFETNVANNKVFVKSFFVNNKQTLQLGEKLRQFRKEKGLSQRKFAEPMGYSHIYISDVERGKLPPSGKLLRKLSEIYGLSIDEILSGEPSGQVKPLPSSIKLADLVGIVEAGLETEDFVSFPIQTFDSTTQAGGQFLGHVVIHKRVFGRRKNLAAVQLNGEKEIKVVIVGK